MERDIEKDLIEIECAMKEHKERDNVFTVTVLQRCLMLVSDLKKYKDVTNKLLTYIINNMHWCPFKDEADIDFEKECVGFAETGCRECILKHIDQLK